MATEAPVCHLPPTVDIPQPAPTNMPAIPLANADPASLLAAVQALTAGYNILAGFTLPRSTGTAQDGQPGQNGKSAKNGNWTEQSRVEKVVRVTNPNDNTQFVDINVIQQLVMVDSQTGHTWVFNR